MTILDYLFPRRCLICQRETGYLCAYCRRKIKSANYRRVFPENSSGLDGILSLFYYRSPAGRLLKEFKYRFVRDIQSILVDLSVTRLKQEPLLRYWKENRFIFLPTPLFPTRRFWRGFNQSQVLLEEISKHLDLTVETNCLIRDRQAKSQAQLSLSQRQTNLKQAFTVSNCHLISNANLVVFDDVFTTGSTLQEIGRVLKSAGAKSVWGLTICR